MSKLHANIDGYYDEQDLNASSSLHGYEHVDEKAGIPDVWMIIIISSLPPTLFTIGVSAFHRMRVGC